MRGNSAAENRELFFQETEKDCQCTGNVLLVGWLSFFGRGLYIFTCFVTFLLFMLQAWGGVFWCVLPPTFVITRYCCQNIKQCPFQQFMCPRYYKLTRLAASQLTREGEKNAENSKYLFYFCNKFLNLFLQTIHTDLYSQQLVLNRNLQCHIIIP